MFRFVLPLLLCDMTKRLKTIDSRNIMKKSLLFFVFPVLICMGACKPEKKNIFHGTVSELITGVSLEDVQVTIEINQVSSGMLSSYQVLGTTSTGSDGSFSFESDAAQALAYRFTFSKDGYHTYSFEITPNDITGDYQIDKAIAREAFLQFMIYNVSPAYDEDILRYRIQGISPGCETCCDNQLHSFYGATDTITFCLLAGYDTITIEYMTYINGSANQFSEEVIVPAGDTVKKVMRY